VNKERKLVEKANFPQKYRLHLGSTEKILVIYLYSQPKDQFIPMHEIIKNIDYNKKSKISNINISLNRLVEKGLVSKKILITNQHRGKTRETAYCMNKKNRELAKNVLFDLYFGRQMLNFLLRRKSYRINSRQLADMDKKLNLGILDIFKI